jgi:hypothetical protein
MDNIADLYSGIATTWVMGLITLKLTFKAVASFIDNQVG